MTDQIEHLLSQIYPNRVQKLLLREIETHKTSLIGAPCHETPFDPERDTLLIAYPGCIRREGQASLETLSECLDFEVLSSFQGLHLLPFYPSTSDFGFAVANHRRVDPQWGNREILRALCKKRNVFADIVLHHVSSQSECFQSWIRGETGRKSIFHKVPTKLPELANGRNANPIGRYDLPDGTVVNLLARYGRDQVDLDHRSPRVFLEVLKTLNWLFETGVAGIRLDAVAYAYKPDGLPVIHNEKTQFLSRSIGAVASYISPHSWLIPEIDTDVYGDLYLKNAPGTSGYAYGLAILIVEACLSCNPDHLAKYLATRRYTDQSIIFLTTHDGLSSRTYDPVLPQSRLKGLAEYARTYGWEATEKNGAVYEINAPIHALLKTRSEKTLELALFLLLSCPGTPMLFLNTLLDTPTWHQGAREKGDIRMLNRGHVSYEQARDSLTKPSRKHFHNTVSRLLKIRRETPHLWRSAPISEIEVQKGILKIHRMYQGVRLCAIANLSNDVQKIQMDCGRSLLFPSGEKYKKLSSNEYDWIIYD